MGRSWFDNKTVVITGASGGIGRGITERLVKEHHCMVFGIARNEQKMTSLLAALGDDADRFSYRLFDVSDRGQWEAFASFLRENRIRPDLLINNAGRLPGFDRFGHCGLDEIERTVNVNFYGAVYAMHALLPLLLESSAPAIVNIDSSAALLTLAGTAAYSASKAALKSLTESMREELRGRCYVGLVCPGFTETDIFRNQNVPDERSEKLLRMVSMPCDRMVGRILKGIRKKRSLMVFGTDAQCMKWFGRWLPVQGSRLLSKVLKLSGLPLFDSVFQRE